MQTLSDRALKERIIGAVVLVLVAVLVVPIFLDGSADDNEIVRTSVTLPGQSNDGTEQQTIVLNRDRSQPVPATTTAAAPLTERKPVAVQPTPIETESAREMPAATSESSSAEEKPPEKAVSTPREAAPPLIAAETSTTGMWAVQLGSFSNEQNAEKLATSLRNQGYAAFLSRLSRDGSALHRVRIGPQKDRDSAEAIAAQLLKSGHTGQVVPHP